MIFDTTWMDNRLGKFTASEIGKLLTSSKKKDEIFGSTAISYIHKKFHERISGEQKELGALPSLEWGKSLENEAILHYEMMTGRKVQSFGGENPQFFEFNEYSGGSPDGFADNDILIEIKCPYNGETFVDYMQFKDPADLYYYNKEYYTQLQFNMICCNKDVAHWVAYDPRIKNPNKRMVILEVEKDDAFCDGLLNRLSLAIDYLKKLEYDFNNM